MPIWPLRGTGAAGGSRGADHPPDARCSFCGRPRATVGPMVEGPNAAFICVDCVRLAHQVAEGNRTQPAAADLDDPAVRWAGHMHVRCYFALRRDGERWQAVAEHPAGFVGVGRSAREAVRDLQARVLSASAEAIAAGHEVGDHYTNHADERLR